MKIKIWGARGSIPTPLRSPALEEKITEAIYNMPANLDTNDMGAIRAYVRKLPPLQRGTAGGNTACVEIMADDDIYIIDAGSGIRELGLQLIKGPAGKGKATIHLFISHPHWDHIQGFPFFVPAFIPGNVINIYSIHDLETALTEQQRAINFPVSLAYMQATRKFIRLKPQTPFTAGALRVNTLANAHPGVAYSLRFEDPHSTFVYASDSEYKNLDSASLQPHLDFFHNADALIFDAQYTLKEAWQKVDWGHSSALIGVDIARSAGVKRLLLFHHDPTYSDKQLEGIESTARAYESQEAHHPDCEVMVAYEGLTLDLTPPGTVDLQYLPTHQTTPILTPTSVFDAHGIGELARQFANLTVQAVNSTPIIDMSRVESLTTATLKALIALHQQEVGRQIVLANLSDNARKIIQLSGYADFFAIYPTVEGAIKALQTKEGLNLPGHLVQNRYRIEHKIGEGRLGVVLKATDTTTNDAVVIKVLNPNFGRKTIQRYMSQGAQIKQLEHRCIVRVRDIVPAEENVFKIEDYANGQSLDQRLQRGPMSLAQATRLIMDVIDALEYAHSRGVLHCDLKPENIFLTKNGAQLSGFGLGHLEQIRNLLDTPLLFLSASSLAPEQISGQPCDVRTDLYALGILMYRLFTGHALFQGNDTYLMEAHLQKKPTPPRKLNPALSAATEHVILKLLAKNPHERYAGVQQIRKIITQLNLPGAPTKFVGRATEKEALRKLWWATQRQNQGGLVYLQGDLGSGKTMLAEQIEPRENMGLVLVGQNSSMTKYWLFHPFNQILHTIFQHTDLNPSEPDVQAHLLNLSPLLPNFTQWIDETSNPTALDADWQEAAFASYTALLQLAAGRQPVLFILENIHQMDELSLAYLAHLSGPTLAQRPWLIVASAERDTIAGNAEGKPFGQPPQLSMSLTGFTRDDMLQALNHVWQHAKTPAALADRLLAQTDGNPLYIEQISKALVDDDIIARQNSDWHFPSDKIKLPAALRDAIWRRVRRLGPDTQTLLRLASVMGRTFDLHALKNISGLSDWELANHLDAAFERHLIYENRYTHHIEFIHQEIQQVLYLDIGPLRHRILHRQVAEYLSKQNDNQDSNAAQLTYHYTEASEAAQATWFSFKAGQHAEQLHAQETATYWYQQTAQQFQELSTTEIDRFKPIQHHLQARNLL